MNSSWITMLRRWQHDRDELVVSHVRPERVGEPVYLRVREVEADSARNCTMLAAKRWPQPFRLSEDEHHGNRAGEVPS